MKRITLVGVVIVAAAGCVKRGGGGGGGGGPARSPGSVYRTTAMGSTVGGAKTTADRGRSKLFTAGLITLGASYGTTVIGGQITSNFLFSEFDRRIGGDETIDKLWFPVIGAWTALAFNEDVVRTNCHDPSFADPMTNPQCDLITLASSMIALGAIAQTTGAVLTVVGLLRDADDKGPTGPPRLVITPHGTAESAGLTIRGLF